MTRCLGLLTTLALLVAVGLGRGETPHGGLTRGDVLWIRTAGQPERQVKLLDTPQADSPCDVLDLDTGARYSLPPRVLARLPKVAPPEVRPAKAPAGQAPVSRALQATPVAPGWPTPGSQAAQGSRFPTTLTRPGERVQPPKSAAPPVSVVRGLLRLDAPPLELAHQVRPHPSVPTPSPRTPPQPSPEPPVRPNPVPTVLTSAPPVTPLPAPVAAPAVTPQVATLALPPTEPSFSTVKMPDAVPVPVPTPAAPLALPPTQPSYSTVKMPTIDAAPVAPQVAVTPVAPQVVVTPATPEVAPPRMAIRSRGVPEVPPVATVRSRAAPEVAAVQQASAVEPASAFAMLPTRQARRAVEGGPFVEVVAEPTPPAGPRAKANVSPPAEPIGLTAAGRLRPVPDQMQTETRFFIEELTNALRPTLRMRAASALADGRYGSRPEIKAVLARAALADPAPEVRAHCVRQLARLGHAESSYLAYLDACAQSGHPTVQAAARAALDGLMPRAR